MNTIPKLKLYQSVRVTDDGFYKGAEGVVISFFIKEDDYDGPYPIYYKVRFADKRIHADYRNDVPSGYHVVSIKETDLEVLSE